jgi:ABC-2 type transport system ATP-binding protein
MDTSILKLEKVKKVFGKVSILDPINLEIRAGEIFGIIGASGSGKTTLLHTLIGFSVPSSGRIMFNKDLKSNNWVHVLNNLNFIKKRVGFAAQHPSFYERLTVYENLDYFGALYNLTREARLSNINTLLELVELDHARNILAKNLSGGMQRRLDIACAIIHNPELLILDEPTSDLDPVLAKHIWKLIKKINKKGTTIIVASHDLSEIETVSTRIGILANKTLNHIGTIEELKKKISRGQEVHFESYPGNYEELAKNLKDPLIIEIENRGNSLVIHTRKPDKILKKLLITLNKLDEHLLDVKITRLSLRDVFANITKKKNEDRKSN